MATAAAQKNTDDQDQATNPQVSQPKEQEPSVETSKQTEKEILKEIVKTSEAADKQAEAEVQKAIAESRDSFLESKGEKEGKLSHPDPKLTPDVADAGVKVPQHEANKVIKHGTTLNLEITEDEYKKGLHTKIAGHVKDKVIYGVSSLAALAIWFSKIIKGAHKHTKNIVFKGGSNPKQEE